jgi:uncharacterized secreted protein with C-terminal beta-propeller domain
MNDKEVKRMLEEKKVPDELLPENIKEMLDRKAPAVKRKKITAVSRFAAIAAACALVSGTAVYFASSGDVFKKSRSKSSETVSGTEAQKPTSNSGTQTTQTTEPDIKNDNTVKPTAYMSGAKDYDEIYALFSSSAEKYKQNALRGYNSKEAVQNRAEEADGQSDLSLSGDDVFNVAEGGKGGGGDYSLTFNQEEGVLESDIIKTDGKRIYSINNSGNKTALNIVDADNGDLSNLVSIDISKDIKGIMGKGYRYSIYTNDMYLYNDSIIVIGTASGTEYREGDGKEENYNWWTGYRNTKSVTFVSIYSTDADHKNLGVYCQDGYMHDVRIAPDGYMYLVSQHHSLNYINVNGAEDIKKYIPAAGMFEDIKCLAPEDIYMPDNSSLVDRVLSYTVVGSVDLNTKGALKPVAAKAFAGYTGEIYCSANNLYTTAPSYGNELPEDVEYGHVEFQNAKTEITRFAVNAGNIVPAACGTIDGYVNDQFSMSEYEGFFRVASTRRENKLTYTKGEYFDYSGVTFDDEGNEISGKPELVEYGYYDFENTKHDNILYVLDLDFNEIGSIDDFGINEDIRSVNFNGDKAFVVTFEQRDPLFAIDLSEPTSPTILSEYKINGYSSYMQQWGDGLLLGFGPDADDEGNTNGVKVTMFDTSDPTTLKLKDTYSLNWSSNERGYSWSAGVNDRKALLIDPKKNIIGFPVSETTYGYYEYDGYAVYDEDAVETYVPTKEVISYKFLSYKDGKFVEKGSLYDNYELSSDDDSYAGNRRAIYIGDYVYTMCDFGITSADMETLSVKDQIRFERNKQLYNELYYSTLLTDE